MRGLCLLLALATPAVAERPAKTSGQQYFSPGQFLNLLRKPAVQADLGLNAELAQQIEERHRRWRERARAKMQAARGKEPMIRKADEAAFAAWSDQELSADAKFARSRLTEAQLLRAQQIERQVEGPLSIIDDDPLMKALALTDDQFLEMDLVRKHYLEAGMAAFRASFVDLDADKFQQGLRRLKTEAERSIHELMTDEQRTKYEQLLGPPFKSDEGR